MMGTTMSVNTSLPKNFVPNRPEPTVKLRLMNSGNCTVLVLPIQIGNASPSATSSCVTPIVATVRIKRGARKKRRRNANSTMTPNTIAVTRPLAAARYTFQPHDE